MRFKGVKKCVKFLKLLVSPLELKLKALASPPFPSPSSLSSPPSLYTEAIPIPFPQSQLHFHSGNAGDGAPGSSLPAAVSVSLLKPLAESKKRARCVLALLQPTTVLPEHRCRCGYSKMCFMNVFIGNAAQTSPSTQELARRHPRKTESETSGGGSS